MDRSTSTRLILVVVLTAFLGTLPAWGAPAAPRAGQPLPELHQLWSLLTSLWVEAGCGLDPHGCPGAQGGSSVDAGCILDPHGGCAASQESSFAEEGCILDPHGGCRESQSTSAFDAGCGIDPHGGCSR